MADGCSRTIVEHDHSYGAEYKDTRHTRLDELDRLCHTHHDLHTHHGWALVAGSGKRPMVPPEDPRHPADAPPEPPVRSAGSAHGADDEMATLVDQALARRARAVHDRIQRQPTARAELFANEPAPVP